MDREPATDMDVSIPPQGRDWRLVDNGAFEQLAGPMYWTTDQLDAEEPIRLGFRVLSKHCNPNNACHGGMMATFLDMVLGMAIDTATGAGGPTMTLNIDYLAAALPGEWIESRTRLVHASYKSGYCDTVLHGPRGVVARANGMWRLLRPK